MRLRDDARVSGRVNLDHHINSALPRANVSHKNAVTASNECTYSSGVRHNIRDIRGTVHGRGRVRALLRQVREPGHLEREALAVDHMPVELVDLEKPRVVSAKLSFSSRHESTHLDPAHRIESALDVGYREAVRTRS